MPISGRKFSYTMPLTSELRTSNLQPRTSNLQLFLCLSNPQSPSLLFLMQLHQLIFTVNSALPATTAGRNTLCAAAIRSRSISGNAMIRPFRSIPVVMSVWMRSTRYMRNSRPWVSSIRTVRSKTNPGACGSSVSWITAGILSISGSTWIELYNYIFLFS